MIKRVKKIFIAFLFVFLLLGLGVGIFAWRYQKIVDWGSELADEHCLVVNPLIIERKMRSQEYMQTLLDPSASASAEKIDELTKAYYLASKKYIKAEDDWISKQESCRHLRQTGTGRRQC